MQHNDRDIYKPSQFLTTIKKLPENEKMIQLMYDKIKTKEHLVEHHSEKVGMTELNNDEMQKMFQPIFDQIGISDAKISYVYMHCMNNGGQFGVHDHDKPHAVYYLQVPQGCASIHFPDFEMEEYFHTPEENKFLVIPELINHGISLHQSNTIRIAITMQLENLI